MRYVILLNESLKSYLLTLEKDKKKRFQEKLEFLEAGILDSGVRVKKLKGISKKVVFEARLTRGDRILFTMGRYADQTAMYIWGIVKHDDISAGAQNILPENAPFLNFQPVEKEEYDEILIEELGDDYYSQEALEEKALEDYGPQKWLVLDEGEWKRILKNSDPDNFELFLYLTREQQEVLKNPPPVLLSGTAGSGKTTISVYYLLDRKFLDKEKLFVTYSPYLKRFSKKIYDGLLNEREMPENAKAPRFFAFPELLSDIFTQCSREFDPNHMVDLKEFERIFKNHHLYKKFDPELVWEEIRSIIKGAHPQISVKRFTQLISRFLKRTLSAREGEELRDYLAGLKNYEFMIKLERAVEKKTKYSSYDEFLLSFPLVNGTGRSSEEFILGELLKILEKKAQAFTHSLLTFSEYEQLGKKRAPNFRYDRKAIYSIAEYYQNELSNRGLKDEIDWCRDAMMCLAPGDSGGRYDLIVCDEVQDFTDIQLSLLFALSRDYKNILFAGDSRQIINPSGFRWEELKVKFYERTITVPRVFHLRLNFRCVGNLVRLANELLDLKKELVGIAGSEFNEDWKFNGKPPLIIHQAKEKDLLEKLQIEGAGQIILVRDKKQKKMIQKKLGTELVFTINEAKGLEFNTVFLWKFSGDKKTLTLWRKIYHEHHLEISHYPHIKHELNLLYVAVTRARNTLIVYDGEATSYIWQMDRIKRHFYWTTNPDELEELWQHISTPGEWEAQGDYFLEREYYKAAWECYKNAGNDEKKERTFAYVLYDDEKYRQAAPLLLKCGFIKEAADSYEKTGSFKEALPLWQRLKDKKRIRRCRIKILEQSDNFDKAADEWIALNRTDMAVKNWERSKNYARLSDYYYSQKEYMKAASCFEKINQYQKAARCYKEVKDDKKAAELFCLAEDYSSALSCYKKCKNIDGIIKCYEKVHDYKALAHYYEKKRDYCKTLEWLKKYGGMSGENREELASEAEKYRKRDSMKAAIRYSAAGLYNKSAPLFFKKKYLAMAIYDYTVMENHQKLIECYEMVEDYYHAALEVEQTDNPDKWDKSTSYLQDYVFENGKYNQPHAVKLLNEAEKYLEKKDFNPALARYKAAKALDKVSDIYIQLKKDNEALSYLINHDSATMEFTEQYLQKRDNLNLSLKFITEVITRLSIPNFFRNEREREKEILLTIILLFVRNNDDPGIFQRCREEFQISIKNQLDRFPLDKSFSGLFIDLLFEIKAYNILYLYTSGLIYSHNVAPDVRDSLLHRCLEAGEKNNDNNFLACYYIEADYVIYSRVVKDLDITEDNYLIFNHSIDNRIKLIDFYVSINDYKNAVSIAKRFKEHEHILSILEKEEQFLRAGNYCRDIKENERALDYYIKAGDREKTARALEKLMRFREAMEIWKELGKFREERRLEKKLKKMNISLETYENYKEQDLF